MGRDVIEQYERPLDALAHRLWTHWSQHIAEEEDISEGRLERWQDLWVPFGELPEPAKETDRRLVERFADEEPDYSRSPNAGAEGDHHTCPNCGADPADVSWQTANNQSVCPEDDDVCPVVSWRHTEDDSQ